MDISKEILESAAQGDVGAFEEIYKISSGFVYGLSLRMLGQVENAQEATQDVFLKVFHGLKNFRFESSFKTWIYRVTVNVCLNQMRKQKHFREKEIHVEEPQALDYLAHTDNKTESEEESMEVVNQMLSTFPEDLS